MNIIQMMHPTARHHQKPTVARFIMRRTARKRSYDSNATADVCCMVDRTYTVFPFRTAIKTRVYGTRNRLIQNRYAVQLLFLLESVLSSVRVFSPCCYCGMGRLIFVFDNYLSFHMRALNENSNIQTFDKGILKYRQFVLYKNISVLQQNDR